MKTVRRALQDVTSFKADSEPLVTVDSLSKLLYHQLELNLEILKQIHDDGNREASSAVAAAGLRGN